MYKELDKVIASLDHLLEGDYSRDTKSDAGAFLHSIQQFLFTSLLNYWYPILKSVKKGSKSVQDPKMWFHEAFCDLKSLVEILNLKSKKIMHDAVHLANEYCKKMRHTNCTTKKKKNDARRNSTR